MSTPEKAYGVIYRIDNSVNGKFYIGQTKMRLGSRWSKHKQDARNGAGWVLAAAMRKYGHEAFSISIVEPHESKDALNAAEIRLIAELKPDYNACAGGGGLGSPTAEVRAKLSAAAKGVKRSAETKANMSAAQKGHPVAPETRAKLKALFTGRYLRKTPHSAEERAATGARGRATRTHPIRTDLLKLYAELGAATRNEKIAAAAKHGFETGRRAKLIGAKNPMFGRAPSEAVRGAMVARNTGAGNPYYGKTHAEEVLAKMRSAHAARPPATCPHCSKTGHLNAMKRWHFDNCRSAA